MHWEYIPALIVLTVVAAFWVGASLGWFAVLKVPDSPVGNVLWMYLMLAAVAASVVFGGGALADLARRVNRRGSRSS